MNKHYSGTSDQYLAKVIRANVDVLMEQYAEMEARGYEVTILCDGKLYTLLDPKKERIISFTKYNKVTL